MLIGERLEKAINQQIGNEFGASMEYLQIASYFESEDMLKFSAIFFEQAAEENAHAMKLLRYVLDAGGEVEIPAIGKPRKQFDSAADAVQAALDWEVTVTGQINNLMQIAVEEKDFIAQNRSAAAPGVCTTSIAVSVTPSSSAAVKALAVTKTCCPFIDSCLNFIFISKVFPFFSSNTFSN